MNAKDQMRKRLDDLQREYKGAASMLAMMEKGTKRDDLAKMRREKLDPLRKEIAKLEGELMSLS